MIAEDPSLQPVRLHLAMALLADHQDEAARTQLEKLRSDELPEDIRNIVSQALDTLRERQSWTFNASGYYRHDKNINDAPRQRERQVGNGKWTFPEPKKRARRTLRPLRRTPHSHPQRLLRPNRSRPERRLVLGRAQL